MDNGLVLLVFGVHPGLPPPPNTVVGQVAKGGHDDRGLPGRHLFGGTRKWAIPDDSVCQRHLAARQYLYYGDSRDEVQRTTQNLEVIQVREDDNPLLIRGAIPGSKGDYVVIRESKKRPKGWKPHAAREEGKKEAKKK